MIYWASEDEFRGSNSPRKGAALKDGGTSVDTPVSPARQHPLLTSRSPPGTNLNLSVSVSYCKVCQLYLLYTNGQTSQTSGLSSLIEVDALTPTSAEPAYLLQGEVRV